MKHIILFLSVIAVLQSCVPAKVGTEQKSLGAGQIVGEDGKLYQSEQFGDLRVLHYYIPQWDSLSLDQKKLVYYLTQAGLAGRDIMWDQNCAANIPVRRALEHI